MHTGSYFIVILTKIEMVRQFRAKFRNIKFHEDSISGSRIVKLVQTEG
jgi:hypothetical protein